MQPNLMEMCAALWARDVKAKFGHKTAPTVKDGLSHADDSETGDCRCW